MKILFNRNNSIGIFCLLLLLAVGAVSCIKDEYAENKEKATVQVTFTTRAVSDGTIVGNELADNERMKTLRVIVAKDGKILYNEYYEEKDFAQYDNGQRYKTVTFSELVTEDEEDRTFDFYAIANEEGIANWPTQITSLEQLPEYITLSTTSDLIPQTAKQSFTVDIPQEGNGIQKGIMQLEFVVAKVRLTIENTSVGDQYVNDIKLSGINMESTPLFANGTLSGVGGGTLSLDKMTIHAGQSATVYAYFFENTGGEYSLTAKWKGDKELKFGSGTTYNIGSIPRGTELDINITLNATTTPSFNIEVVPWTEVKVDVPPFE